jgi:hypothetical protein
VLIHGAVDHLSLDNTSPLERQTFQLHLVDTVGGVEWAKTNWMQYREGWTFPKLNQDVIAYPNQHNGAGSSVRLEL